MAEARPPDSDDPADWATVFCQQAVDQNYPCIDWHLMRARFDAAMRRALRERSHWLERKRFVSHSGRQLDFKIECDALTDEEIATFAAIIAARQGFSEVVGVPRGGIRLADALRSHCTEGPLLVVDDVLTTGWSMEEYRAGGHDVIGAVMFARGPCPDWVLPVFQMTEPPHG
jgi:orotate phosphoribosyltransferase